ncbi:MAG: ABC transporter permease [Christensenellales bacterium]
MSDNRPENAALEPNLLKHTGGPRENRAGTLGDEQRVRVLSPGMMVFKRFIRNRLAITGFIILVVMFIFSFIGGLLTPYRQDQTFFSTESMLKEYAGATRNSELRYTVADGESFSKGAYARMILAINNQEPHFTSNGKNYTYVAFGDQQYAIQEIKTLATVATHKNLFSYKPAVGFSPQAAFKTAFEAAFKAGETAFTFEGTDYQIVRSSSREAVIGQAFSVAVASMHIFDAGRQEDIATLEAYPFRLAAERAIASSAATFEAEGVGYGLEGQGGSYLIKRLDSQDKTPFAAVSGFIVNAIMPDVFLTLDFKAAAVSAMEGNQSKFTFEDVDYTISLVHQNYNIKSLVETHVFDMYHRPDATHLLGTDQNGMDVLTRLMYGGRISLMVGFIVVFLEMLIGVIIGGISGYYGKWIDTMLMRFIDLFNSIPTWPILIITGSVMDTLEIDPYARLFLMMFILGLLGWTGIARVVRGQILALREQDFMVATEATGIRVSRRIGKHLVPNVMPLLIVQATMSLGGIILLEATLSFLGLGIKHPLASWGSIINAASNPYVMTNFWFIWLPAGLLILLTVLGFNFVGDGLRDAFDPKMKR